MTKALVALNDATYGGVYYSANIDFTNLATQPTWTKYATTGLANTLIKVMQNDKFTPYTNIYVQLDNDDVYRWNGASWTKILDLATARTISGLGAGTVGYIAINQTIAGALYIAIQTSATCHLLKSTDYGANWTDSTVATDLMTGTAFVAASGNYFVVCTGEIYRMAYMSNGGVLWTFQALWNNSAGGAPVRIDPHDPQYFYYRKDSADADLIKVKVGTITELQNGFNLAGIGNHEERHWIDPITANHHRIVTNYAIYSTIDGWANLVDSTPTALIVGPLKAVGALACALENETYGMFGFTEKGAAVTLVYGFVGDNPASATGIAGTNWNTPPYTNAIPYTADAYIAFQGIYVGEGPVSSGVFVYADEMGDITSLPSYTGLGTPMFGDRSAWRDRPIDGFDIYHAEDVQRAEPQIHAPWDDTNPPTAGKTIVSDGAKWIVSDASGLVVRGSAAECFGDSVTLGTGASDNAHKYANIIAATMGWTLTNSAAGSEELADTISGYIYQRSPLVTSQYFLLEGYNDMRHHGTDAGGQATFRDALYAALAYLAIPQANKITGQGAGVAYGGVWSNTPVYGGTLGKFIAAAGSTATFTVNGRTIYIGITALDVSGGAFNVTVDGVAYGQYSCTGITQPNSALQYAPRLIRIAGLDTGPHVVVLTTADNNNTYFDWAAGADGNITMTGPTVYCGNCLRMTVAGYAAGGAGWTNGSDAAAADFNALIKRICEDLAGDGLDIAHVDATGYYEPSTDVGADNVHPNDTGYANLATAFLAMIDNRARPIDRWLPDEYLRLKHNLTATSAPGLTNDLTEGYAVGSRWFDITADKEYVCLDATNGAAVWTETTGTSTVTVSTILDYIHEHAINENLSGLCDGVRTIFILANEYKIETTAVYLNGVRQFIVTDYTEDAGYDQITMTTAPEASDILIIDYILADAIP